MSGSDDGDHEPPASGTERGERGGGWRSLWPPPPGCGGARTSSWRSWCRSRQQPRCRGRHGGGDHRGGGRGLHPRGPGGRRTRSGVVVAGGVGTA